MLSNGVRLRCSFALVIYASRLVASHAQEAGWRDGDVQAVALDGRNGNGYYGVVGKYVLLPLPTDVIECEQVANVGSRRTGDDVRWVLGGTVGLLCGGGLSTVVERGCVDTRAPPRTAVMLR